MARHLSVVVILAIAAFVVLSFMTSFGNRTEQIRHVLPAAAVPEQPPIKSEATLADAKAGAKSAVKPEAKPDAKPEVKTDAGAGLSLLSADILSGGAIAPKLENATIKCAFLFSLSPL